MTRFLPRSLLGQMLLAVALALFAAQGISALLLVRAQEHRAELAVLNVAAFRLAYGQGDGEGRFSGRFTQRGDKPRHVRGVALERGAQSPIAESEPREVGSEAFLRATLADQGIEPVQLTVTTRHIVDDPFVAQWLKRSLRRGMPPPDATDRPMLVASMQRENGGEWVTARVPYPEREPRAVGGIILQTAILYIVLVGGLALLLRRMTRPLAALTARVESFAGNRQSEIKLEPTGPEDTRRLIIAHNAMEARIAALLDEKNVMLGAIGHDLKTPLAGLRVRIESVQDEAQRRRMAESIEDITHTLDDILSLARVGHPADTPEQLELSALVAAIVEEYEDVDAPVSLGETDRIALPARSTWLRRGLRNLIDNALRYGKAARISLHREGDRATIRVEDDGPGIPEGEIAAMLEPFRRGDSSRNRGTGGSGLGLTLARAIAEQHGGSLSLANRRDGEGRITGLSAEIRLPIGAKRTSP